MQLFAVCRRKMPKFQPEEIKVALGQARLLGITRYSKPNDNTIFFYDDEENMRMRIKIGFKLWTGCIPGGELDRDDVYSIEKLRKRYEH